MNHPSSIGFAQFGILALDSLPATLPVKALGAGPGRLSGGTQRLTGAGWPSPLDPLLKAAHRFFENPLQ